MVEFTNKWCTKSSVNRLLKKFRDTGTVNRVNRLTGSDRPQSASTEENLTWLMIWFLSQEHTQHTHRKVHEILIID